MYVNVRNMDENTIIEQTTIIERRKKNTSKLR
jgi:hypothetical protein